MIKQVFIKKYEIGLVFNRGDFERALLPGKHIVSGFNRTTKVFSRLDTQWTNPELEQLVMEPAIREHLHVIDLKGNQRALIWKNGRIHRVLAPGLFGFWKEPHQIDIETLEVPENLRFEHPNLEEITKLPEARGILQTVMVEPFEELLLIKNGKLICTTGPGKYVFWQNAGTLQWETIDRREQTLDVAGQEIMTHDKVSLRVNLLVSFKVVHAEDSWMKVHDFKQALYRDAQLHLRAVVGTRNLETLLSDKEAIGQEVHKSLTHKAMKFGVEVTGLGLRDIILPGDMKMILNQVTQAQKQAEANLIKRREETAAARSQANTAKLLVSNPVLMRLKELETLQEILTTTNATFFFGKGDLLEQFNQLVTLPHETK